MSRAIEARAENGGDLGEIGVQCAGVNVEDLVKNSLRALERARAHAVQHAVEGMEIIGIVADNVVMAAAQEHISERGNGQLLRNGEEQRGDNNECLASITEGLNTLARLRRDSEDVGGECRPSADKKSGIVLVGLDKLDADPANRARGVGEEHGETIIASSGLGQADSDVCGADTLNSCELRKRLGRSTKCRVALKISVGMSKTIRKEGIGAENLSLDGILLELHPRVVGNSKVLVARMEKAHVARLVILVKILQQRMTLGGVAATGHSSEDVPAEPHEITLARLNVGANGSKRSLGAGEGMAVATLGLKNGRKHANHTHTVRARPATILQSALESAANDVPALLGNNRLRRVGQSTSNGARNFEDAGGRENGRVVDKRVHELIENIALEAIKIGAHRVRGKGLHQREDITRLRDAGGGKAKSIKAILEGSVGLGGDNSAGGRRHAQDAADGAGERLH